MPFVHARSTRLNRDLIQAMFGIHMQLADLHRHLDGSLRPSTVLDFASALGLVVPEKLHFWPGMGLSEALSKFEFTLQLLQSPHAVARVASEMVEDAIAEGVSTLEIRFAPQLHRGAAIEEIVDAAVDGAAGRAGIILCGLYGEDPSILEKAVHIAATRSGVVGIDLAGGPQTNDVWKLEDYAPAFTLAREYGLGRTVHAGEGRPPQEIRIAIESLHAQRIGHGTTVLEDPSVVDLVLERNITIEACLTSNVHTGAIARLGDHPLPRWLLLGIRACVCADNTLLSRVNAAQELEHARTLPGMNDTLARAAVQNGHDARFARAQ